jgi:RND family efflux transporter MFP subunit
MNRRRNALIVIAVLVVLVVAGALAHHGPSAVAVRLVKVNYGTFETKLPESGVVQLPRTVTIPAYVAGNLGYIAVKAGDRVTKGQLLASIVNDQISSNVRDAEETAAAAHAKVESVSETNAVLPEQNRSSVLQAEAAVVAARSQLTQAQQDLASGSQSGLGYGGTTAEEQRLEADATLSKAATDYHEAQRLYEADKNLYDQKALSRDALMQQQARLQEAQVTYDQARSERTILGGQLTRETQVLRDRLGSARDGVLQAEAALASARANAGESKQGDLAAAQADAARADADLAYARDQASKLQVFAPFDGTVQSVASQPNDTLRPIQPGDAVALGQSLFTLASDDNFIVRTKVDEQDVSGLQIGQLAVVSGEDFNGAKLGGRVASISPVAQRSDDPSNTSRQVLTTIALDRRLPFLRDGMTVDVDIVTRHDRHVITAPIDAIRKDDKGSYVLVVRDGRAQRTAVTLGDQSDTDTIVTSGLHDGDTIVAEKDAEVGDGTAVKPAPSPSSGLTPEPTDSGG